MTVSVDSRYAQSSIDKLTTTRGLVFTIVSSAQVDFAVVYTSYIWEQGDRIDLLADLHYGNVTKWFLIGDANPEVMDWSDVDPGTIIRIPTS